MFADIDRDRVGVLGAKNLQAWALTNGGQLNQNHSLILYYALLRRHYTSLNLEVFCENVAPMEWGGYREYQHSLADQQRQEINEKQARCREALEQEHQFYQAIHKHINVSEVHREAALMRELELDSRVDEESKEYQ